jgi:hypothetical protein
MMRCSIAPKPGSEASDEVPSHKIENGRFVSLNFPAIAKKHVMTKLTPVNKIEDFAVIIRAIHERGQAEADAPRRAKRPQPVGLPTNKKRRAGLVDDTPLWYTDKYEPFISPVDKPVSAFDEEALNA